MELDIDIFIDEVNSYKKYKLTIVFSNNFTYYLYSNFLPTIYNTITKVENGQFPDILTIGKPQ